jgi:glycosyltransferase 2 family protein
MTTEGDQNPVAAGTRRNRLARAGDMASRVGSLEPSDPALRRGLHAAIAIVLILGVGLAIVGSAHELPDVDWRWRPLSLGLGILGFAAMMLASAEIWQGILRALGPRLDRATAVRIWFLSGLGRFVPTSLLMPVVRIAASGREGVPKRIALVSIVYEVAILLTAALVVGAYSLITLPGLQDYPERYLALAAPLVGLIVLQPSVFRPLADRVLDRLGRERLPAVLNGRQAAAFLGLYGLTFVLAGLSVYALAQSVYPVPASDIPTVIGAFALGTFLGVVAFALPGGLVAREAGLAVGLAPIMPTAPAIAIAVLARIVQVSVEVLIVTVSLARLRFAGREEPVGPRSSTSPTP